MSLEHPGDSDNTPQLTTVQRIRFHPVGELASERLYIKLPRGQVTQLGRDSITLAPYSTASTRTYFGRFPAAYFQRWTAVRRVAFRAVVQGSGRMRAYATDDLDRDRIVGSVEIESERAESVSIEVDIDRFLDGGFIWVDLESGDRTLTVTDLRVEAVEGAAAKDLAVVICTFNRPKDCVNTLLALASDLEAFALVTDVYVVDQGTDLVREQPEFEQIGREMGARLRYIEQPNLGGAGGFTRGIYEVLAPGVTDGDIILMDDDIVLEPETVLRLSAFSARTIHPVIVGAQMLYLYHPNILHTSAEDADLSRLRAGIPVDPREQGIDLRKELPFRWAEGGYNAWWTCLIPQKVVGEIGYPLPLFFQWDDIEYGLRARGRGIPTVTLPGSAVWHADFALKDRDDWSRYFSYRNSLIVAALHGQWKSARSSAALLRDLVEMIMSMHYGLAATAIAAIDGFLAGPDAVRSGSGDAAADVRRLRAAYPDTVRHRPEEMVETGLFSLPAMHSGGYPRIPWLVVIKRSLWQVIGFNKLVGKISSADSNWYHSSQFRRAIVTDAALDSFRIRTFDSRTALHLLKASAGALWRLRRNGAKAASAWKNALPILADRKSWSRIFSNAGPNR